MFSRKYTLNFDGSHNNQANTASAGCIIRDDNGDLVVAAAYNLTKTNLPCYNVAIAEAIGLRNGLRLARQHSIHLKLIKGDNKQVIDLVLGQSKRPPGPPLAGIIVEIMVMVSQGFAEVKLINGEDNKVADKLAYIGSLLGTDSKVFTRFNSHDLPRQVTELINQDKILSSAKESTNDGDGDGESNIAKVGSAVAGLAMLAWGAYKVFSGEGGSSAVAGLAMLAWGAYKLFSGKGGSTAVAGLAMLAWGAYKLFSGEGGSTAVAGLAMLAWGAYKLFSREGGSSDPPPPPTNNYPAPRSSFISTPSLYTLQYFGSDRNQLQKARAGCIIKNSRGEFRIAAAYNLNNQYLDCNVAIAEAIALRNGLKLAQENNIRLNIIQGRNVEVRDRVLNLEKRPPKSRDLIQFINQIQTSLSNQSISNLKDTLKLVDEDDIKVARALATVGGMLLQDFEIYDSVRALPPRVAMIFNGSI